MPDKTTSSSAAQVASVELYPYETNLRLAKEAIYHAIGAICDDPRKFWLIGGPTGTWEKLTEAHAALWSMSIEEVRSGFVPRKAEYDRYCKEKEDAEELLEHCRENGLTLKYLRENCITALVS